MQTRRRTHMKYIGMPMGMWVVFAGGGKRTFPATVYAPARRICMMNITETLSEL